jgi:hypothetical protein
LASVVSTLAAFMISRLPLRTVEEENMQGNEQRA